MNGAPLLREILLRRGIALAVALYCILGLALIAQKPGLQYDEALLVAGGVHMQHSAARFELEDTPNAWVCPFHRCVPLMAFLYVGSAKEFANLPFFALLGGRASFIRMVALLFGIPAIWGLARLVDRCFGRTEAVISALALAINPGFLNMVLFDNGANGGLFAALGLTCAGLAAYVGQASALRAFGIGAAMGFGIWSRTNFVWLLAAGGISALIVFRRRMLIPLSHFAAIVVGGIMGGFPFLLYQFVSKGATWKAQDLFRDSGSMALLIRERIFYFADTLLADGEHREMWSGPSLPAWQMWFFPGVVALACVVCLLHRSGGDSRRKFAQFFALTFVLTGSLLVSSRLPVAEHHLVMLTPFALAVTALACSILQTRFRRVWMLSVVLCVIYGASAIYWQLESIRGLKKSGGVGMWSNGGTELASYLDQNFRGREIRILDWGLAYNLYVLTDGRLKPQQLYSPQSEETSSSGRPWSDEIHDGGVFVLNGPENREFPKPSAGFLRALAVERPNVQLHTINERNGSIYAEVIAITPGSESGAQATGDSPEIRIPMSQREYDGQLTGFYPPERGGVRWTKREFSVSLPLAHLLRPPTGGFQLVVQLYIPETTIQKLGPLTLRTEFDGHALAPETWSEPGLHVLHRPLDNDWVVNGSSGKADFSLDKAVPPSSTDARELGIMVREISVGVGQIY